MSVEQSPPPTLPPSLAPSPVPRHPNCPGFVGAKSGEAETCTVHQNVCLLDPCLPPPWSPTEWSLSWASKGKRALWLVEKNASLSSVEVLLNCSCPGVLVFLMGIWSSPKGFSGLCTVKWMTAWEQSGLCDSYLLRVSLLSLSLTWQKSLQILRNFLSVAECSQCFLLFSSQSFYQVCFFPTKHS